MISKSAPGEGGREAGEQAPEPGRRRRVGVPGPELPREEHPHLVVPQVVGAGEDELEDVVARAGHVVVDAEVVARLAEDDHGVRQVVAVVVVLPAVPVVVVPEASGTADRCPAGAGASQVVDVVLGVVRLRRIGRAVARELEDAEREELEQLASEVLVGVHVHAVVARDVHDAVEVVEVRGILVEGADQIAEVAARILAEEAVLDRHVAELHLLGRAAREVVVPEEDEPLAAGVGRRARTDHLLQPPALHLEPAEAVDDVRAGRLPLQGREGEQLAHRAPDGGVPVEERLDLRRRAAEGRPAEQVRRVLVVPGHSHARSPVWRLSRRCRRPSPWPAQGRGSRRR